MVIHNMPKLDSPFVRKDINNKHVVIDAVNPGYEWVFDDNRVIATEKLNGTNVSIIIENGKITRIFNRTTEIPFFNKGKTFIVQGVLEAFQRDYTNFTDGQYFGELIGPKVQGNPYKLQQHVWVPFEGYVKDHLRYKSWGKYPTDFETISRWFKEDLFSLYQARLGGEKVFPEGVVFYHPDGRMAKLRRDMFDWYDGPQHGEKEK